MYPVRVGGSHGDGAIKKIILPVAGCTHAKLQRTKGVRAANHLRGGAGSKPDITLEIGELEAAQGRRDAGDAIPHHELVVGREIGRDLQGTGSWIPAGIAAGVQRERLKRAAKPV